MLPSLVVNGWWISSLRPQTGLGTAVWVPEGWAISWEVVRTEKHMPRHQNALLPGLAAADCCMLCPWPFHICIWPKAPLPGGEKAPSDAILAYSASFMTMEAGRNKGYRRRVSWWLPTFHLTDKGLKTLQLQNEDWVVTRRILANCEGKNHFCWTHQGPRTILAHSGLLMAGYQRTWRLEKWMTSRMN